MSVTVLQVHKGQQDLWDRQGRKEHKDHRDWPRSPR
jgi:hypothetical protein